MLPFSLLRPPAPAAKPTAPSKSETKVGGLFDDEDDLFSSSLTTPTAPPPETKPQWVECCNYVSIVWLMKVCHVEREKKERDSARIWTWALWLPVRCSYHWATGALALEQRIRCTISIHWHSSILRPDLPGSNSGWIFFFFWTSISELFPILCFSLKHT